MLNKSKEQMDTFEHSVYISYFIILLSNKNVYIEF